MNWNVRPKPVLKWAGGKQILAEELVGRFPSRYSTFYEPFVGGASVLLQADPERAVVGDLNPWLVDTYRAIRRGWKKVAAVLDTLPNTKEDYFRIRKIQPGALNHVERAAHLIYLNKTCFRGLFRVNRRGEFNVPYGGYQRRYYDPDNLAAFAARLRRFDIRCQDFELTIADARPGDFIYCDPPYYKYGGYSDFNRYTPSQFRENDHLRLAACCRELDERGIQWAVSNSNTRFIRCVYEGFRILECNNRREINLNSQSRNISELFITNF